MSLFLILTKKWYICNYLACGYLTNKIYCFGGVGNDVNRTAFDAAMNMLDISSNIGSTADALKSKWEKVATASNNLDIQARDSPQFMQMPDGKTLLISGGWIYSNTNLAYQTIAFNGETQTWNSYANYIEGSYGNRQMWVNSPVF